MIENLCDYILKDGVLQLYGRTGIINAQTKLCDKGTGKRANYQKDVFSSVGTLVISEGIRIIDNDFSRMIDDYCIHPHEIILSDGIKIIEEEAFSNMYFIERIKLPETITEIKKATFSQCGSLKSVIVPASVAKIGDCAFEGCYSLEKLTIHNGIVSLGRKVFIGCNELKHVDLPDTIINIGPEIFWGCEGTVKIFDMTLSMANMRNPETYYKLRDYMNTPTEEAFASFERNVRVSLAIKFYGQGEWHHKYLANSKQAIDCILAGKDIKQLDFMMDHKLINEENLERSIKFTIENKMPEFYAVLLQYKQGIKGYDKKDERWEI